MKDIPVAIEGREETVVTFENTAASLGSGTLPVYGTPSLCALIESACLKSMLPFLEEHEGTVGIKIEINHTAATPIGMKVWAESELIEHEGRKLVFKVKAYDEAGEIGTAIHERFIIYTEKFMAKAEAKKNQ